MEQKVSPCIISAKIYKPFFKDKDKNVVPYIYNLTNSQLHVYVLPFTISTNFCYHWMSRSRNTYYKVFHCGVSITTFKGC